MFVDCYPFVVCNWFDIQVLYVLRCSEFLSGDSEGAQGKVQANSQRWRPLKRYLGCSNIAVTGVTAGHGALLVLKGEPMVDGRNLRHAGEDEVKRSYRQLVLLVHPDKTANEVPQEDASEAFRILSSAFKVAIELARNRATYGAGSVGSAPQPDSKAGRGNGSNAAGGSEKAPRRGHARAYPDVEAEIRAFEEEVLRDLRAQAAVREERARVKAKQRAAKQEACFAAAQQEVSQLLGNEKKCKALDKRASSWQKFRTKKGAGQRRSHQAVGEAARRLDTSIETVAEDAACDSEQAGTTTKARQPFDWSIPPPAKRHAVDDRANGECWMDVTDAKSTTTRINDRWTHDKFVEQTSQPQDTLVAAREAYANHFTREMRGLESCAKQRHILQAEQQ
ncbi:hypothetical protein CYMTET_55438 [Cymbomonas tetramitiformis]|uniref:J domain-containing protein n=1 Tax=Cymbomonas tetramitiformis TaxID=36881 RepID=A0AAE0BE35_9CHLO|nr:hypothetical protein CYMTET_55438 [Cymbomonas tetramitiformis]